jgi:FkbM family methyltransferase
MLFNACVIDVGAYIGAFTLYSLYNNAKQCIAIEPNFISRYFLKINLEINKQMIDLKKVAILSSAVSDYAGTAKLFVGDFKKVPGTATLIKSFAEKHRLGCFVKVPVETIDIIAERLRLESINFVKIDVEGSELNVINGAKQAILKFRPIMAVAAYHYPAEAIEIATLLKSSYRYNVMINKDGYVYALP